MTTTFHQGSPQFPTVSGSIPPSPLAAMDMAVQTLHAHKDEWLAFPVRQRLALLDRLIADFAAIAPRWVAACAQAKGIAPASPLVAEEWGAGVIPVIKNLHQLRQALVDIEAHGRPRILGPITTRTNGQVVAQVFPQTIYDRLFSTASQRRFGWNQG